uniref:DUF3615 domain-containing protein n=1 Tax=Chenopodium quinoa TaxID=63459 RepID=A0A803MIU5_CHEQI
MVSDASKKKAAQKKAAVAAKGGSKAPASSKAAAQSVDKVTEAAGDMAISDRNCTCILCSHPMSRDVGIESSSVTFHGHDQIDLIDSMLELHYGSLKRTPLSALTHLSPRERTSKHSKKYIPLAVKALEYYNSKEHKNLKFVEVCVAAENGDYVHINFHGSSDDALEKLLFAELKYSNAKENDCDTLEVEGCCVLEKIDSGPRDGFRIISGDPFKDYKFWDYHPCAFEAVSQYSELTTHYQMFHDCAMKAIDHYNFHQDAKFKFVEMIGGASRVSDVKRIIHINFKGKSSFKQKEVLFFAELSIPLFEIEVSSQRWEDYKKSFIQVKGCCQLKLLDSGNPWGRTCGLCYGRVKHPGPKDGYCIVAGDEFIGSEFMNIGLGIY